MSWRYCGEVHLRSECKDNERQGSVERQEGSVDTAYIPSCRAAERRIQEAGGMGGYAKVKAKIR